MEKLKAPFPWFGGKSRAASIVWARFGRLDLYVEPFFGSGAVLLSRPRRDNCIEVANDKDCFVANFWRALQWAPEELAQHVDWPVNEADLHARHLWLIRQPDWAERIKTDPAYFDVRIAGWWAWGISMWLGGEWCADVERPSRRIPVHRHSGSGLMRQTLDGEISKIEVYLQRLAARLRNVRVCCGDWRRVCGGTSLTSAGTTGVFLDPPYSAAANREASVYATEDLNVAHDVRAWAIERGGDKNLRIALCGYEGEHAMPRDWTCVAWKATGGMGNWKSRQTQGESRGKANARRERIWFSPSCLDGRQWRM